jgi:hypothetical protein
MNNFNQFANQIIEYKKSNQFQQALELFKNEKSNYSHEQIANNKYLVAAIIACLRKTNQYKYVNNFLNTYNIQINENTDDIILNVYGWSIYDICKDEVEHEHFNKGNLLSLISYPIHLIASKKSNFSYAVISNIFRLILKKEKEQQNKNYEFINNFCDLFNPDLLSKETETFKAENKDIEIASDYESWCANKSKALFELNHFQECYDVSKIAIENITIYHYNNDLWFARRIALSKKELGNIEEAITDLEIIFQKKREWFIQKELAGLYFEVKEIEKAFAYAIQAIGTNGFGKLEFKIGLIFLLGRILKQQMNLPMASKHFLAVKTIREQNGWKMTQELQDELNSLELEGINQENLIKELKLYWQKHQPKKDDSTLTGTIKRILNDNDKGKNGFLTSGGEDYYFNLPAHLQFTKYTQEGCIVKFTPLAQTGDRKSAKIISVEPNLA